MFHACSSAGMFAPELHAGCPEMLDETAAWRMSFPIPAPGKRRMMVHRDARVFAAPMLNLPFTMTFIMRIDRRAI